MRLQSNRSDKFVSTTHPLWYSAHAHHFGGTWLEANDYPPGVEIENAEAGAIVGEAGFILRVKAI